MNNNRPIEALHAIDELGQPFTTAPIEKQVTETIYTDEVPDFVGATLERLYACVYCTLARIEAHDSLERINTYVRKDDSTISAVILFRIDRHIVSVINQQINLPTEKLLRFCDTIFRTFSHARVVQFYGIEARLDRFPFPYQQVQSIEENIIHFPSTKEAYLSSLRSQFLRQLRTNASKIAVDHPSFSLRMADRSAIEEQQVMHILDLAKQRMRAKGRPIYSDNINRAALMKTLKKYGHVVMATIDDRICAGSIFFSVGKRHFHTYIAHDPEYDQYMLGNQMWLAAILYSIDLRAEECWLMGGASVHKSRFKAKPYSFNSITIYRSTLHALLHGRLVAGQWLKQKKRELKAACQEHLEKKTAIGRLIEKSIVARNAMQANKTRP